MPIEFHPAHEAEALLKGLPEIAFFGHSNVGKSTLLNTLLGHKVARTSRTPGRTRAVHYYTENNRRFVDLPGYGYASGSKHERKELAYLLDAYLSHTQDLVALCFLFDLGRSPTKMDKDSLDYLRQQLDTAQIKLVFTKADKTSSSKRLTVVKKTLTQFNRYFPDTPLELSRDCLVTSSKDKPGCATLKKWIFAL